MMSHDSAPVDLSSGPKRYVPNFIFPEDTVQALARAYSYTQFRERPEGSIPHFSDLDREKARAFLRSSAEVTDEGRWLLPEAAMALLKMYGIPVAETMAATSAQEAGEAAAKLGFPVAMKVRSSTIVHKTDVGGIALNLRTREDLERAYAEMERRVKDAGRGAEMQGVVLQPMASSGQEVIVGMSQDRVFGPLVMVGLGGVQVEMIKDVAFSLHPLTDLEPDRMLRQLKSLPMLTGWRGS
jgi:acetyltransferase